MEGINEDISLADQPEICFFSTFPPKECGIATFTRDLLSGMDRRFNPKLKSRVIAVNESQGIYNYSNKVIMEVNKDDIEQYIEVAKRINDSDEIKLINIQHEFGIFGGEYGSYLIPFLETVTKPVVLTFHSILPRPNPIRRNVVRAIASRCSAIIVMTNSALNILVDDYGIGRSKLHLIPHGVPNVSFHKNNSHIKRKLKLSNRIVLSTFGLLSRGKGIEYVIRSLPAIIKKYPNLIYLVLGETHPVVRRKEGESYRNELTSLVEKLNLKGHVKFYNKYLTLKEIISYLLATDVYVYPNLEKNQATSGTLAYAIGCGKAVVATPTIYAEDIIANKGGVLVEFKNPTSYVKAVDKMLSDPEFKKNIEEAAYTFSRSMVWSNVAHLYLKVFNKVVHLRKELIEKFPKINLKHMKNLSDDYGIVQFAKNVIPDKDLGYSLDDNTRALIVAVMHNKIFNSSFSSRLARIYLDFIKSSQQKDGNFKNQSFNPEEKYNPYSEDSFGRAIWALGFTIKNSRDEYLGCESERMIRNALNNIDNISSPRAKAFSIIGLSCYQKKIHNDTIYSKIKMLTDSLVTLYNAESSDDWQWFEPSLTYSNATLPKALLFAYEATGEKEYLKIAEKTLNFLSEIYIINGKLYPIGQSSWFYKNKRRSLFDQQPEDTSALVQAFLTAYSITNKREYYDKAVLSFNWFLGNNHLNQMIYDENTGGCFDGLAKNSLNTNQGAESTISYLIPRLFLEEIKRKRKT